MGVMADYRVFLYNLKAQVVYAELPFSGLSYSYVMDEPGSASLEIPIGVPKLDGSPLTPEDVFPAATGLLIQRGEELVWGGIVWSYRLNLGRRTLTLSAQGYLSYYTQRLTHPDGVEFKGVEQTAMVASLITSANGSGGIGTDTSLITPTDMVRDRSWNPYEMKPLAEVFTDLADDITSKDPQTGKYGGGFFLYFEPYWVTPGSVVGNRAWNTPDRHPYDSGIVLQQAVNCEFTDIDVDGKGLTTHVYAVGATDGTQSLTPFAEDTNPHLEEKIPHLESVLSETSVKENITLQYKVRSALAFGAEPVVMPQAQTYPGMFSPLELQPGMRVGATTDDGFLNLINDDYVITETSATVGSDGSDRLALTLVQSSLFQETEEG